MENDPFRLYQSYINVVKPLDYAQKERVFGEEIALLKQKLEAATLRADSIQKACESYLAEEKALKAELKQLKNDLADEKEAHAEDVRNLNDDIALWMTKYKIDTNLLKTNFSNLSSYTDIERDVSQAAISKLVAKVNRISLQFRGVSNILNVPRLTD